MKTQTLQERIQHAMDTTTFQPTKIFLRGLLDALSKKGKLSPKQLECLANTEKKMGIKNDVDDAISEMEPSKPFNLKDHIKTSLPEKNIETRLQSIECLLIELLEKCS